MCSSIPELASAAGTRRNRLDCAVRKLGIRESMARLKRVDCSGPGIRRRRRGKGFEYLDEDGAPHHRTRRGRADPCAGHPACLGGGLDLPPPDGSHPGHGDGRRWTQAVPLPRSLARATRPGEVRRDVRFRARSSGAAQAREARPRPRGHASREGPRLCHAAARPRLLSHRVRGLRRRERHVRAGDDEEASRDRGRRPGDLRLRGQGRQAPPPGNRRPAGGGDRPPAQTPPRGGRRVARLQGGSEPGWTSSRRTSTRT